MELSVRQYNILFDALQLYPSHQKGRYSMMQGALYGTVMNFDHITEIRLKQFAGVTIFERGADYHRSGQVHSIAEI